jgi:3-hydroxybutyryl-CoA dehydrogenase
MTRIAVLGAGPLAAQIGCEYALGGCSVLWSDDDEAGPASAAAVEDALRVAATAGLAGPAELERARSLMSRGDPTISSAERLTVILDAQHLPLEQRASSIAEIAARHPEALVASATPVASVTALGEAAGVPDRMLATRYGDPPLLSPVVELLAARDTPQRLVERVSQLLRALGKHPLLLRREVPGLVAGRLELALLREAAWLIERGVIDADTLDELVRDSLARRWALVGPVASAALSSPEELIELAHAVGTEQPGGAAANGLASLTGSADQERLPVLRERRDDGLAAALRSERAGAARSSENGS